MKYLNLTAALLFIALSLSGCGLFAIRGSGNIVSSPRFHEGFTSIDISQTCDLTVLQGSAYSVEVSIDDNILPYLETYVEGGELNIELQRGQNYSNLSFSAIVTMPVITGLEASGASSAYLSGFNATGTFDVDVSGASDVRLDFLSSQSFDCEVSGASDLFISSANSSGSLELECSGASDCDLRNVSFNSADVDISGASSVHIDVTGEIRGEVSGASDLYYRGAPQSISLDVSGASSLSSY